MPAHPVAHALLLACGLPIAAPSANLFSRPSPTAARHVLDNLAGRVDLVLDGGATTIGLESTVVDLTQTPPVLLRPGGVGVAALRTLLPDLPRTKHASGRDGYRSGVIARDAAQALRAAHTHDPAARRGGR